MHHDDETTDHHDDDDRPEQTDQTTGDTTGEMTPADREAIELRDDLELLDAELAALGLPDLDPADDERMPWDRLPNESPRQFARFLTYRDLTSWDRPHHRSVEALTEPPYNLARSTVYQLAKLHQWRQRAEAWDLHLRRIWEADQEHRQRQVSEKAMDATTAALDASAATFLAHGPGTGSLLTPDQAAKAITSVAPIVREILRPAETTVNVNVTPADPRAAHRALMDDYRRRMMEPGTDAIFREAAGRIFDGSRPGPSLEAIEATYTEDTTDTPDDTGETTAD